MKEKYDLELSLEHIFEYMFSCLVSLGYAPNEEEVEDVAELAYDFIIEWLMDQGVVSEVFEVEGEEE